MIQSHSTSVRSADAGGTSRIVARRAIENGRARAAAWIDGASVLGSLPGKLMDALFSPTAIRAGNHGDVYWREPPGGNLFFAVPAGIGFLAGAIGPAIAHQDPSFLLFSPFTGALGGLAGATLGGAAFLALVSLQAVLPTAATVVGVATSPVAFLWGALQGALAAPSTPPPEEPKSRSLPSAMGRSFSLPRLPATDESSRIPAEIGAR